MLLRQNGARWAYDMYRSRVTILNGTIFGQLGSPLPSVQIGIELGDNNLTFKLRTNGGRQRKNLYEEAR